MQKVTSYKILAAVAVAAVITLAIVGYWFADEKSEPVYLSKIDKLMFDKDNKAPKFVLTLPEQKDFRQGGETPIISASPDLPVLPPPTQKGDAFQEPEQETLQDIIAQIPNLNQLTDQPQTQTLKHIVQDVEMVETQGTLNLPKIAQDGRRPWSEYGESVNTLPNFKKVALIIKGLGLDSLSLDKVVKGLDSEVSISLSPYAADADKKLISARQLGHETYIDLLLSSKDDCYTCEKYLPILEVGIEGINTPAYYIDRDLYDDGSEAWNEFISLDDRIVQNFMYTPYLMYFKEGKFEAELVGKKDQDFLEQFFENNGI